MKNKLGDRYQHLMAVAQIIFPISVSLGVFAGLLIARMTKIL